MNSKQIQADMERIYAESLKAYERSLSPWGRLRELGAFLAGGVVTVGLVACCYIVYGWLHIR